MNVAKFEFAAACAVLSVFPAESVAGADEEYGVNLVCWADAMLANDKIAMQKNITTNFREMVDINILIIHLLAGLQYMAG